MTNDNKKPWYYARTEEDLNSVYKMFWRFHYFRVQKIAYLPENEEIDLYLEYDSYDIGLLLKFIENVSMNFVPNDDYEADWLSGATIGLNAKKQIVWAADEDIDVKNLPSYPLWIVGDKFKYALIDKSDNTIEIPNTILHQIHSIYDYEKKAYVDEKFDYELI